MLNSPKTLEKEDLYKFVEPWLGTGLFTAPGNCKIGNVMWHTNNVLLSNLKLLSGFMTRILNLLTLLLCMSFLYSHKVAKTQEIDFTNVQPTNLGHVHKCV